MNSDQMHMLITAVSIVGIVVLYALGKGTEAALLMSFLGGAGLVSGTQTAVTQVKKAQE